MEVDCRIIPVLEGKCELGPQTSNWRKIRGRTGETFYVTKELDKEGVRNRLVEIKEKGIQSISVALAHSYTVYEHEVEIGNIAREIGKIMKYVLKLVKLFMLCYMTKNVC